MAYKHLDPTQYGLSSRTILVGIKPGHIGIMKNRKSRIIMKDGEKIIETAKQILQSSPKTRISLITNAPVCSKTKQHLTENKITIIHENPQINQSSYQEKDTTR